MKAFVVGNGTSRKDIDLNLLKKHGKIFGCNALYREFSPDYLVAVDYKMIDEINHHKYQLKNQVWTNPFRLQSKFKGFNTFEKSKGWSSGPTALWFASEKQFNTIYILGFDYQGINEKVNNIYAGTLNYKKDNEPATFYGNWLRQTVITIRSNPNIEYIRVIDNQNFIPTEFTYLNNLKHINTYQFIKEIK